MNNLSGEFIENPRDGKTFAGEKQRRSETSTNRTMQYRKKHGKRVEHEKRPMLITVNASEKPTGQVYVDGFGNEFDAHVASTPNGKTKFIH